MRPTYHLSTSASYVYDPIQRSLYSADNITDLADASQDRDVIEALLQSLVPLGVWRIVGDDATLLGSSYYDSADDWADDEHEARTMDVCIREAIAKAEEAERKEAERIAGTTD